MSIRWPGLAKAGSSAVTITAAALRKVGLIPGGNGRPSRPEMPRIASVTYARLLSPVPCSPTTTP